MFEGKSIWQIVHMGGFTMYTLLICSVISIAVTLERVWTFAVKSRTDMETLLASIRRMCEQGNVAAAVKLCERTPGSVAAVALAGLRKQGHDEKSVAGAMERAIMLETADLERFTGVVGTIGNIAVYIGLFGTVIGIVRSFHNISLAGSGGLSVVIGGVSEALLATATGLLVAIPAVVAYNYFMRRIDVFVKNMEYCLSAVTDILAGGEPR